MKPAKKKIFSIQKLGKGKSVEYNYSAITYLATSLTFRESLKSFQKKRLGSAEAADVVDSGAVGPDEKKNIFNSKVWKRQIGRV